VGKRIGTVAAIRNFASLAYGGNRGRSGC
jgi:hypothetical protein